MQIETAEQFALDICNFHLDTYSNVVASCQVYIEQTPWQRTNSSAHSNHGFIHNPDAIRFAEIEQKRNGKNKMLPNPKHSVPLEVDSIVTSYCK